jgi:integrase/recombinase XerD
MSRPASKVARVRVMGPLALFAPTVKVRLRASGYTPLTTVNVMRLMAHLSRWMDANGLGVTDLTSEQVNRYVAARRAGGRKSGLSPRSLAPILAVLAGAGALAPEAAAAPASGRDRLLAAFERHLLGERALAEPTAAAYVARARRFLEGVAGGELAGLTAGHVTRAVLTETEAVSAGSARAT